MDELEKAHISLQTYANSARPKHLLWVFGHLKTYSTERVATRLVGGVDPKTYRKRSWILIKNGMDWPTRKKYPFDPKNQKN
eukprot:13722126-Ditylum_brightwellii.AAC.1